MVLLLELLALVVVLAYTWRFPLAGGRYRIKWHRLLMRPRLILVLWNLWRNS